MFTDLAAVIAPRSESRWSLFGPPLLRRRRWRRRHCGRRRLGRRGAGHRRSRAPERHHAVVDQPGGARGLAETTRLPDDAAVHRVRGSPTSPTRWNFVAIQLDATHTLEGDLPPIAMTFPSDSAVYPMRMSAGAESPQQPMVYLLAGHRMVRTDPTAEGSTRPDLRFAGPVDPADVTSPTLRELAGRPRRTSPPASSGCPTPPRSSPTSPSARPPPTSPSTRSTTSSTTCCPATWVRC